MVYRHESCFIINLEEWISHCFYRSHCCLDGRLLGDFHFFACSNHSIINVHCSYNSNIITVNALEVYFNIMCSPHIWLSKILIIIINVKKKKYPENKEYRGASVWTLKTVYFVHFDLLMFVHWVYIILIIKGEVLKYVNEIWGADFYILSLLSFNQQKSPFKQRHFFNHFKKADILQGNSKRIIPQSSSLS